MVLVGFQFLHWRRMSLAPVGEGRVTIISEWIEHDISQDKWGQRQTVSLWVRLRNDYAAVLTVTPTALVAPTRFRG